jgi:hypothetical protein
MSCHVTLPILADEGDKKPTRVDDLADSRAQRSSAGRYCHFGRVAPMEKRHVPCVGCSVVVDGNYRDRRTVRLPV